ncbi:MAG: hypothetical protein LBB36_04775 [Fibromonadaceae bacterium]|jgi:predicted Holliday junction resolvase-like endonuclease|nr:hypothetical protein [Fibromonadaceae bacterium]
MTLYMVLFFLGFMLAIGLLAYASMQVAELNKKTEIFGKNLYERYSKPLAKLEEEKKEKEKEELKEKNEPKTEKNTQAEK